MLDEFFTVFYTMENTCSGGADPLAGKAVRRNFMPPIRNFPRSDRPHNGASDGEVSTVHLATISTPIP